MIALAPDKQSFFYPALLLAIVTFVVTYILLLVSGITSPVIALRAQEDKLAGLTEVLRPGSFTPAVLHTTTTESYQGQSFEVATAIDSNGFASGYAVETAANGFAGPIKLLIGLDKQLRITGVRVLAHTETPGLGDKIELARSDWVLSFNGRTLSSIDAPTWQVRKDGGDFDQFTGATITPRAIVQQVDLTLRMMLDWQANQQAATQQPNQEPTQTANPSASQPISQTEEPAND